MNMSLSTVPSAPLTCTEPALNVGVYRFTFRLMEATTVPGFEGSTLRGLFGHGLRRVHCVTGAPSCQGCPVSANCNYSLLFESPLPGDSGVLKAGVAGPHPFVIRAGRPGRQRRYRAGDTFQVNMALFGRANIYLPAVFPAFEEAGSGLVQPVPGSSSSTSNGRRRPAVNNGGPYRVMAPGPCPTTISISHPSRHGSG